MTISHNIEPFLHATIANLLTEEENTILYSICEEMCIPYETSINDLSFFVLDKDKPSLEKEGLAYCKRNGMIMNNVGIELIDTNLETVHSIQGNIQKKLESSEFTSVFPILYDKKTEKPMRWCIGLTLTSDFKESPLRPHTDNPSDLVEWGLKNNLEVSCGIYKGVIFIANPNLEYTDYGTRFYHSKETSSEFLEVPFIGGNSCIFKTSSNSYHGTDFKNGLPNRRYTLTMEYY